MDGWNTIYFPFGVGNVYLSVAFTGSFQGGIYHSSTDVRHAATKELPSWPRCVRRWHVSCCPRRGLHPPNAELPKVPHPKNAQDSNHKAIQGMKTNKTFKKTTVYMFTMFSLKASKNAALIPNPFNFMHLWRTGIRGVYSKRLSHKASQGLQLLIHVGLPNPNRKQCQKTWNPSKFCIFILASVWRPVEAALIN